MELIIQEEYQYHRSKIYLKDIRNGKTVIIGYDGEYLVETVLESGATNIEVKPLLTLPYGMVDDLTRLFIKEGEKKNLRTDNENLLKGKLTSTELHLSDMRNFATMLLKNKLK